MNNHLVTIVLSVALALAVLVLLGTASAVRLPGDHQKFEPTQPIAFSHRLHAGELKIQCLYCHSAAEKGRYAGIPSAENCMNCHRMVTAPWGAVRAEDEKATQEKRSPHRIVSPELQKLYNDLALDDKMQPLAGRDPQPIPWVRIHDLPDFVYFDHRAHVQAGVACQDCHGPVDTMEQVRQVQNLSMGWCVSCHRNANAQGVNGRPVQASLDCSACHH